MTRFANNLTASSLIALAAMLVVVCPVLAAVDEVQLKNMASTDDNLIQLREIAYLTGPTAEKLGSSIVAKLRDNQSDCRISLSTVQKHLTDMGVNWGRFNLAGAASCDVQLVQDHPAPVNTAIASNPRQTITATNAITIGQHVMRYLLSYTGLDDQQLVVHFNETDQRELDQPALLDRFEFEVLSSTKLGQLPLVIRRWQGNNMVGELHVTAQVACKTLAAVVVNNIRRGEIFSPSDVQVQEVLLSTSDEKPIRKMRDVVGLMATRNIRKNQTLFTSDVQQPYVIKRGQLVTVRALVGGMVIRTTARSMDDGAVGDTIQLQNQRSRQQFMARVIGPREAVLGNGNDSDSLSMAGSTR